MWRGVARRREAHMSRLDREAAVRRILEEATPPVPPALYAEAVRRGGRILRRRTVARRLLWLLLFAATVAFVVWAVMARPWVEPPSDTTPPLTGW
jgi:ferric-dicitrate binding protein FerR (iron transport regulator)